LKQQKKNFDRDEDIAASNLPLLVIFFHAGSFAAGASRAIRRNPASRTPSCGVPHGL
jgi:hypothetical protein